MSNVALLIPSEQGCRCWRRRGFASQASTASQCRRSFPQGSQSSRWPCAGAQSRVTGRFWRQLRSRHDRCRAWQRKRSSKERLKQVVLNTGAGAKRRTQYELKIAALAEKGPNLKCKSQAEEPVFRTVVPARFGSKARPNPFIEGTANGGARLCALPAPVAPLSAPHVER
jgi:hypothetical protein